MFLLALGLLAAIYGAVSALYPSLDLRPWINAHEDRIATLGGVIAAIYGAIYVLLGFASRLRGRSAAEKKLGAEARIEVKFPDGSVKTTSVDPNSEDSIKEFLTIIHNYADSKKGSSTENI